MDYKVLDNSRYPKTNLFKMIFIRNEENRTSISRFKWLKLTVIEIFFGEELIENIVNSSTSSSSRKDQCQYGKELKLNSFIPSGIFTNFCRESLIEVLYYKYYKQYFLLRPSQNIDRSDINHEQKIIDCSLIQFSSFKEVLHQLISMRRIYELNHLIVNLSVDSLIYVFTNRVDLALLSALLVESVRRALKI